MTVNYPVCAGVELAFLEPAPLRNVLVGGIESLLEGIRKVWGKKEIERQKEREGRKRKSSEREEEGQRAAFSENGGKIGRPMFLI